MSGALLVAGTTSDAGKSVLVAGICRWLARQGVKVAPFKAQNMALNSGVTAEGAEIGRAQVMQAAAAGVEPEAAMNPVLLKPGGDRATQVVVMGRAAGAETAVSYQTRKAALRAVALDALADLRSRFDVVICEGAGSPTEINLRRHDLANMGLARAADLPTIVVADIDRGGMFAALHGTLALLEPADQALVAGWVVNKFRGDPAVLEPGLRQLRALTGRPTLGVLPWVGGLQLDVEDSLGLDAPREPSGPPLGRDGITVAVVRLRRLSNFTDVDALAAEPGVSVHFTLDPAALRRADLVVVPGTKTTVEDLGLIRAHGIDRVLAERAAAGDPVLGVCGGYQLLGTRIDDGIESTTATVEGLGLLPVTTRFADDKVLGRVAGASPLLGADAAGYEIRHGRVTREGGEAWLRTADGADEGCAVGSVLGTSWHGLLESDDLRRALLAFVAERRGLDFAPATISFAALREARLDVLGDLVEAHLDTTALRSLIDVGAPAGLPVVPPAGAPDPEAIA
jgi:adenosylcobyric acid synthase